MSGLAFEKGTNVAPGCGHITFGLRFCTLAHGDSSVLHFVLALAQGASEKYDTKYDTFYVWFLYIKNIYDWVLTKPVRTLKLT